MNIGRVFKQARERQGLPLKIMSSRLGLTPSALWKIENGSSWPKQKTIQAFSMVTRMPVARIYIESIEPTDY